VNDDLSIIWKEASGYHYVPAFAWGVEKNYESIKKGRQFEVENRNPEFIISSILRLYNKGFIR
jgi:hypothetical protein